MRIFICTFFLAVIANAEPQDYKAREQEGQIQLKTPYGEKTLIGDYTTGAYRIEIPLDDIEPEWVKRKRHEAKLNGEGGNSTNTERNTTSTNTNSTSTVAATEKETRIIEKTIINENGDDFIGPKKLPPKVIVEYDDSDRLVLEANRLFNRRKFDEALATLDELLRRKPTFVRGWIMKGSVMYVRGHKDLAKTAWNQALTLDPENADIKSILEKYK